MNNETISTWKKKLIAFKVFLPIVIKAIIQLYEEIMEAYDEQNMQRLKTLNEVSKEMGKFENYNN